jgi:hypothetical protein
MRCVEIESRRLLLIATVVGFRSPQERDYHHRPWIHSDDLSTGKQGKTIHSRRPSYNA